MRITLALSTGLLKVVVVSPLLFSFFFLFAPLVLVRYGEGSSMTPCTAYVSKSRLTARFPLLREFHPHKEDVIGDLDVYDDAPFCVFKFEMKSGIDSPRTI